MRYSAAVLRRQRSLTLALALGLCGPLALGGCKDKKKEALDERKSAPLKYEDVPAASQADVREVANASYQRSLAEQLDLVPADAPGYVVVRDLRPLVDQARQIEQVMAGPLTRAIPALARMGGGDGEARLAQVAGMREIVRLILAGLEGSGIDLSKGVVIGDPEGEPVVAFAAGDLERLGALASVVGDEAVEFVKGCGTLADMEGWVVCSLAGPEGLARYQPGMAGEAEAAAFAKRLAGVELDRVNVALSLGKAPAVPGQPAAGFDAALRTDPGLWELSVPMPMPEGAPLLTTSGGQALRGLVPGTSFVWVHVDPAGLDEGTPGMGAMVGQLLTGELFLGAADDPAGLVVQAGVGDASEAAKGIQRMAQMLPPSPYEPPELPGVVVELDRASIGLDGKLVPSLGFQLTGQGAEQWKATLGVDTRARLWAYGDYMTLAAGEVQELPVALGRLRGEGPSPEAVASLPPTLARSLLAGEVGVAMHMVLDHWQAPPSEAELAAMFAGLPAERRPDPEGITALFEALAPWSSLDLWLRRPEGQDQWFIQLSLVPFGAPGDGVSEAEVEAAGAAVDAVLAGEGGADAYAKLLERFPDSPRAVAYRARLGQAPEHHAAVGMIQLSLVGAIVVPTFADYLTRSKAAEGQNETAAVLASALAARERAGDCEALIGKAGPTPPLSVPCGVGAGGRCRAGEPEELDEPGRYPIKSWTEDPIWTAVGYQPQAGHRFHYEFEGKAEGEGGCKLVARAYGDLDGDGVFSTYEREASVAADGSKRSPPMQVDKPEE